jgi:hypothetical protein
MGMLLGATIPPERPVEEDQALGVAAHARALVHVAPLGMQLHGGRAFIMGQKALRMGLAGHFPMGHKALCWLFRALTTIWGQQHVLETQTGSVPFGWAVSRTPIVSQKNAPHQAQ